MATWPGGNTGYAEVKKIKLSIYISVADSGGVFGG